MRGCSEQPCIAWFYGNRAQWLDVWVMEANFLGQSQAWPLASCMTLVLNFYMPLSPHLPNEDNNTYFTWLL